MQSLFAAVIDYSDDPSDVYDDGGDDVIETPLDPGPGVTSTPTPTAWLPEPTEPIWPGPTTCGNSGC